MEMNWVSVKDGLPEPEAPVLICTKEPDIYLASLGGHRDTFWEMHSGIDWSVRDVTHWMLQPPPPEE